MKQQRENNQKLQNKQKIKKKMLTNYVWKVILFYCELFETSVNTLLWPTSHWEWHAHYIKYSFHPGCWDTQNLFSAHGSSFLAVKDILLHDN